MFTEKLCDKIVNYQGSKRLIFDRRKQEALYIGLENYGPREV